MSFSLFLLWYLVPHYVLYSFLLLFFPFWLLMTAPLDFCHSQQKKSGKAQTMVDQACARWNFFLKREKKFPLLLLTVSISFILCLIDKMGQTARLSSNREKDLLFFSLYYCKLSLSLTIHHISLSFISSFPKWFVTVTIFYFQFDELWSQHWKKKKSKKYNFAYS